jgi:hypothetical protein
VPASTGNSCDINKMQGIFILESCGKYANYSLNICDEIKKKKYRTIVTLLKSNQEFVETEENLIQLIHIYMSCFPLMQAQGSPLISSKFQRQ